MSEPSPKISFIPKGSLVREESFLERPRSRSAFGITAVLLFTVSVVSFAGLYFFNNFLETKISANLEKVESVQKTFSATPQVEKAKSFRFRAEIVRGLLDSHIAVSSVLKFLSENTVKSIMYNKLSFASDGGIVTVKLLGEAPTYSALAYQKELFKKSSTAIMRVTISDVSLNEFGTVLFTATLRFSPQYLSYVKNIAATQAPSLPTPEGSGSSVLPSSPTSSLGLPLALPLKSQPLQVVNQAPAPTANKTVPGAITLPPPVSAGAVTPASFNGGASSTPGVRSGGVVSSGSSAQNNSVPAAPASKPIVIPTTPAAPASVLSSFWSWFKFW